MKNRLLQTLTLGIILSLFPLLSVTGQNLLQGSDMEAASESAWTAVQLSDADLPTLNWGQTADVPVEGEGGALQITASGGANFALYQEVQLTEGDIYEANVAFKMVSGFRDNSWNEYYIMTTPPQKGVDFENDQAKIAGLSGWWHPSNVMDGNLKQHGIDQKHFTAPSSGTYYFIVKLGNTGGGYHVILDEIYFGSLLPEAIFSAAPRSGSLPLEVQFTSTSTPEGLNHYWEFGDGATSTEENPIHVYNELGKYTVSLKVSNAETENTLVKTDYIDVLQIAAIDGGGVLEGGNMEVADQSKWQIVYLNTPEDQRPVATWGYTDKTPVAGQNGGLRIQASANDATVQYCIYQQVTLSADKVYRFNAGFRDLSPDLFGFFNEVFIGKEIEPSNGVDFGTDDGTRIGNISVWDVNSPIRGIDGTFAINGETQEFIPEESGDYWFVFKAGAYAGAADGVRAFDIVVDELLLEEVGTKPYVNFSATNNQGFSPLTVEFVNTTKFGETYEWDFGDGSAKSNEVSPTHQYDAIGNYTVTLTATNSIGDSTLVKTNFVSVVEREALPEGEMLYGGNMENGGYWRTARVKGVVEVIPTWNYTENTPTGAEGGALRLQAPHQSGSGSNIALYQSIRVQDGYAYSFDCLFKNIGNTNQLWVQPYIVAEEPDDANDPLDESNTLGQLNTWVDGSVVNFDGTMSEKAVAGGNHPYELLTYVHEGDDADMYFVLKIGTWDHALDIVMDNLSLKEEFYVEKPKANFSADITVGDDVPFEVQFFDESINATEWAWDLGDGTTSTEQDPFHVYTETGSYTVSLTVSNGPHSDTMTKVGFIQIGVSSVKNVLIDLCNIVTNNGIIHISSKEDLNLVSIYNLQGMLIERGSLSSGKYQSGQLTTGAYILQIDNHTLKVLVK